MLGLRCDNMFVFLELFLDVTGHGDINRSVVVVPFQFDATVQVTGPIFGECICMFDAFDEMIDILLIDVFYAKIVDNEGEQNRSCFVGP
jgi:hypothetical protein